MPCGCMHDVSKISSNIPNGFNFFKQDLVKENDSYPEYK